MPAPRLHRPHIPAGPASEVHKVGVTDAVLSAEYVRASSRRANYSERFFASDPLAGSDNNLDLAGRIAVLPVRTD